MEKAENCSIIVEFTTATSSTNVLKVKSCNIQKISCTSCANFRMQNCKQTTETKHQLVDGQDGSRANAAQNIKLTLLKTNLNDS